MATINLGNIKFNWKGTYNAGTAYAVDDVVSYNGSSYVCILASTGNLPTNTTYWNVMSEAGTDGTDLTSTLTTQGDIVYRDASGLARLGAGTSGQFLKTQGTGANPVWGDAGGGLLQVRFTQSGTTQYSTTSSSFVDVGAEYDISITPTSANNRIMLFTQLAPQMSTQGRGYYTISKSGDTSGSGSANGNLAGADGMANVENIAQQGNGWVSFMHIDHVNSTNALTYKLQHRTSTGTLSTGVAGSTNVFYAYEIDGSLF